MTYMYKVSTGIIYGPSANFVNVFSDLGSLERDSGKYFNRSIPLPAYKGTCDNSVVISF